MLFEKVNSTEAAALDFQKLCDKVADGHAQQKPDHRGDQSRGHTDQTFGGKLFEYFIYDGGGKGYANDKAREERGFLFANPFQLRE